MYGVGLGHVPWTMSDLFSLEVRGIGTGIGTSTNWVSLQYSFIVSWFFYNRRVTCLLVNHISLCRKEWRHLVSLHCPNHKRWSALGTFGLFAGFIFCGWVYLGFCYPETTGLQLEEVQDILADGFGVRKSMELRKTKRKALKAMKNTNIDQIDPESK